MESSFEALLAEGQFTEISTLSIGKHVIDRPRPASRICLPTFPVKDINIYHISHFREETTIMPEDGKIIKDKSNYPTLGRPSASVSFIIPLQHLGKAGCYRCLLKNRCRTVAHIYLILLHIFCHADNGNQKSFFLNIYSTRLLVSIEAEKSPCITSMDL